MSWSSRRRTLYLFGFILVLLLIVGLPTAYILYDPPTCSDGIQNGGEEGVDCGGGCQLVCSFQAADPIVYWSRVFEIVPGVYSAVALVENPNATFEARHVPYTFKLRDENNILVAEQQGTILLAAKKKIPIFVTGIETGSRVPLRADFEWSGGITWSKGDPHEIPVTIRDRAFENGDTQPRLVATIVNTGVTDIIDLPVVAILYDSEENVLHASRTIVDRLRPSASEPIIFTWPQPFPRPVSKIEIIPVIEE